MQLSHYMLYTAISNILIGFLVMCFRGETTLCRRVLPVGHQDHWHAVLKSFTLLTVSNFSVVRYCDWQEEVASVGHGT